MAKHRKRHQRNSYTRERKLYILNYFRENGENKYKTCKEFNLNSKTLSTWIKEEDKILQMPVGKRANRYRLPRYPDVEESLYGEYLKQKQKGYKASRSWLRNKAKEIMDVLHPNEKFKFSSHWFSRFKERYGLAGQNTKYEIAPHAEFNKANSVNECTSDLDKSAYDGETVIFVAPCSPKDRSDGDERELKCLCSYCLGHEPIGEMTTPRMPPACSNEEEGLNSEEDTIDYKQNGKKSRLGGKTERKTPSLE